MGGSSVDDGWLISSPYAGLCTLVLVGCTGNGKSATGNSILQKTAFVSGAKSSGVTRTCEMHTTVLKDGQSLNVIDTPGLFDCSAKTEFTLKEIAKCINMAKDGIHAVLVVLSFKTRFTEGEEAVVSSLRTLFGEKLTDYMIIVFTGGDELEFHKMTLRDYLGQDCPKPLQVISFCQSCNGHLAQMACLSYIRNFHNSSTYVNRNSCLFDCSAKTEFTLKEIAKCINMAKDGIHAVLVVLSFKTRFTEGEEAVVSSLRTLFGEKLTDYMIIVFTGGDELEFHKMTLRDYLGQDCPKPLQELLHQCENRWVLFDNRTLDQKKKDEQVQVLLSLVNRVVAKNGGKPYTDELFVELKKGATKLNDQTEQVTRQDNEEKLIKRITEMVELKFRENTARLEQQLAEEKARLEQKLAEEKARLEQKLAEEKAGLEQKLAEEKAGLEQKLAEEKAGLEQKLAKEKAGLEQKLAEEKSGFEQKLAEGKSGFEQKLAEDKARLEQQLVEEKAARLRAHSAQEKSIDEIHKMRENLERAERELREQAGRMNCAIL